MEKVKQIEQILDLIIKNDTTFKSFNKILSESHKIFKIKKTNVDAYSYPLNIDWEWIEIIDWEIGEKWDMIITDFLLDRVQSNKYQPCGLLSIIIFISRINISEQLLYKILSKILYDILDDQIYTKILYAYINHINDIYVINRDNYSNLDVNLEPNTTRDWLNLFHITQNFDPNKDPFDLLFTLIDIKKPPKQFINYYIKLKPLPRSRLVGYYSMPEYLLYGININKIKEQLKNNELDLKFYIAMLLRLDNPMLQYDLPIDHDIISNIIANYWFDIGRYFLYNIFIDKRGDSFFVKYKYKDINNVFMNLLDNSDYFKSIIKKFEWPFDFSVFLLCCNNLIDQTNGKYFHVLKEKLSEPLLNKWIDEFENFNKNLLYYIREELNNKEKIFSKFINYSKLDKQFVIAISYICLYILESKPHQDKFYRLFEKHLYQIKLLFYGEQAYFAERLITFWLLFFISTITIYNYNIPDNYAKKIIDTIAKITLFPYLRYIERFIWDNERIELYSEFLNFIIINLKKDETNQIIAYLYKRWNELTTLNLQDV